MSARVVPRLVSPTFASRRAFSRSLPRLARPGVKPKTQTDEAAANQEPSPDAAEPHTGAPKSAGYKEWLKKEGSAFKDFPRRGSPWLGDDVPFPFNPTFKPPPPIGQGVRDAIFFRHSADPAKNDSRVLSARFGISIKRVEAIIRLKALEEAHRKKRPLQTGFLAGMEYLLRVPTNQRTASSHMNTPIDLTDRPETQAGDFAADSMASTSDTSRRMTRSYFEMVDEGSRPIVPDEVDGHHQRQLQYEEGRRINNTDAQSTFVFKAPGAPASRGLFEFVDVGKKFFDKKDVKARDKEADRRRLVKTRKRERNEEVTGQATSLPRSKQATATLS